VGPEEAWRRSYFDGDAAQEEEALHFQGQQQTTAKPAESIPATKKKNARLFAYVKKKQLWMPRATPLPA